jgi:hypothetical protein
MNSNYEEYMDYIQFPSIFNSSDFEVTEFSELDDDDDLLMRIISAILLFVMILFGIFANLLLLQIVVFKWKVQTAFNLFLANLALADILYTAATSANLITHMFTGEYIYGPIMCKIIAFFEYFGPLLSILTIVTALLVLQFKVGFLVTGAVLIFICICASFPSCIQAMLFHITKIKKSDKEEITLCIKTYTTETVENGHNELDKILQVLIPLAVLIIYFTLWIIQMIFPGVKTLGGFVYDRLLIVMALIYIFLWMVVLNLIHNINSYKIENMMIILFTTHVLSGLTVVYKPFIYMYMHEGIQREFYRYLHVGSIGSERNQFV